MATNQNCQIDYAETDSALGTRKRADDLSCPRCPERRLRAVRLGADEIGLLCSGCGLQTVIASPDPDPDPHRLLLDDPIRRNRFFQEMAREHHEALVKRIRLKPPAPWPHPRFRRGWREGTRRVLTFRVPT
jgi:hypothetical protein